ncbi:MAG: hypothetical protein ACK4M9_13465 [Anaerobacillus sp.]|uniref:hypothetical protein n=1 Tax=Anaerobacillus sp. TaxID=1872506 RepID=UPI0039199CB1
MLQVTFYYEGEHSIFELLSELKFKYDNGTYVLNASTYTAVIVHDAANKKLLLTFSKELSFDQYKSLHKVIKTIAENISASVDDHLALMGYLGDGSEAFIFNGWSHWMIFLEDAKHVSMEGQKVQVFNNDVLLGEGILMAFQKDKTVKEDFRIIECLLITKNGERTLLGDHLKIIATGEF